MADVDRTIFVKVVTLDPVSSAPIPVPDARIKVQHRVPFWFDQTLSQGEPVTGNDGIAEVVLRFEESDEPSLNPYFTLTLPEGLREISSGTLSPSRPSFTLPGEWESRHDGISRIRNLTTDFGDRARPFTVYIGLGTEIRLAYSDYRGGRSNPIALPENAIELTLVDEDIFFDDTLTGVGYNPHENRIIPLGKNEGDDQNEDRYPYFDNQLTVPHVLDLPEEAPPRAWVDPPGAPLGTLGGGSFQQVGPLATGPDGFVFMVDAAAESHPVIHRFYPDGTLCETVSTWSEGSRSQQFQQPLSLAVDVNRRLLVADTRSILVFSLNDRFVELTPARQLPAGAGTYQFSHRWSQWTDHTADPVIGALAFLGRPQGMSVWVSANGREEFLAVADAGRGASPTENAAVHVFSLSASSRGELTHRVSFSAGENVVPVAVAGSPTGQIVVGSASQHQVSSWQLQPPGSGWTVTQTWLVGGPVGSGDNQFNSPAGVAVDAKQGRVYVADVNNRRVQLLNGANGAFVATWNDPYPAAPANLPELMAIAVDPRGEVYLADQGNQQVLRATPYAVSGSPMGANTPPRHGATWTSRRELPHLNQPSYGHLDQSGHLWVSDTGNNRVICYATNSVTGEWQISRTITELSAPVGMATAPDGAVFIVESGANQIARLAVNSRTPTILTLDRPLDRPRGLAFALRGEAQTLYVADMGNNRVLRINVGNGTSSALAQAGPGSPLNAPEDLAIDGQGRLIVADTGNNRLVRFNAEDGFEQVIPLTDPSYGLEAPNGLSITPDDQLLITDRARQRVIELSVLGSGRSVAISLRHFWDFQRFVPQTLYTSWRANQPSRVRYGGGLRVDAASAYFGSRAFRVVSSGLIELLEGSDVRQSIPVQPGDLVLVGDGQTIADGGRVAIISRPTIFNADLARQILLASPQRAVLTSGGLLAIADPGHHRIRLLRIHTNLATNLFELGLGLFEGSPDLYLRGRSRFDWRRDANLRLQVAAGPSVDSFGDPKAWKSPVQDEYTADTYRYANTFTDQSPIQARAINAVQVMRQVQRWMVHITRTDAADQRWGRAGGPESLAAELIDDDDGSYHRFFRDVISLGAALSGRGHDAWDDAVIAHEMGHWIFDYTLLRPQMDELRGLYPGSTEHFNSYLYQASIALVEGYAEYIGLFWGDEYAPTDRLRGYSSQDLDQLTPQRPGLVERPPAEASDLSPVDLYHQRNLGLISEGYVANTLWQIHQAVANPAIYFADSPSYWWAYNSRLSEAQSQRLVDLLRLPFRQFPTSSAAWVNSPTEHLFRQILTQAHSQHADCGPLIQQIYEINNQLMPQLRLRRLEGGNPGAIVNSLLSLAPGAELALVADLRDATGAVLAGHNLLFRLEGGGSLTLATPAIPPTRGATISDSFGYSDERPTNVQGEVRFTYRAPATSADALVLKLAYRPRFFSPLPDPADNREVALQKLYMQALHRVGSTGNTGFELSLTLEVRLS